MNKFRNINFKLSEEDLKKALETKEKAGFTTLTGMIKFILRNGNEIIKKMITQRFCEGSSNNTKFKNVVQ